MTHGMNTGEKWDVSLAQNFKMFIPFDPVVSLLGIQPETRELYTQGRLVCYLK